MAILDGLYDYGVSEDTSMGDLDLLQRKLTVIARAGASGSIMLFLDEPLAGLTQAEARSLLNFSRMALPNTMRIWVSHDRIPGLVPEAYLRVAEGAVWVEESKGV